MAKHFYGGDEIEALDKALLANGGVWSNKNETLLVGPNEVPIEYEDVARFSHGEDKLGERRVVIEDPMDVFNTLILIDENGIDGADGGTSNRQLELVEAELLHLMEYSGSTMMTIEKVRQQLGHRVFLTRIEKWIPSGRSDWYEAIKRRGNVLRLNRNEI